MSFLINNYLKPEILYYICLDEYEKDIILLPSYIIDSSGDWNYYNENFMKLFENKELAKDFINEKIGGWRKRFFDHGIETTLLLNNERDGVFMQTLDGKREATISIKQLNLL